VLDAAGRPDHWIDLSHIVCRERTVADVVSTRATPIVTRTPRPVRHDAVRERLELTQVERRIDIVFDDLDETDELGATLQLSGQQQ
jgi:hypothetical protein